MPLAQGRDWSDIIRRLEDAVYQFPEFSAVVWFNAINPFGIFGDYLSRMGAGAITGTPAWQDAAGVQLSLPPHPPLIIAPGVQLSLLSAVRLVTCGEWSWIVVPPEDEPRRTTALSTFSQLVPEVVGGAEAEVEDGRPFPTDGCGWGFLLTLMADAAGNKQCCRRAHRRGVPEDRWLVADPGLWQAAGHEMPDGWCVTMPHLFQRATDYLRSLSRPPIPAKISAVGPKDFDFGEGVILTGFTAHDLELLAVVKEAGTQGSPVADVAKKLGKSEKAVWTQLGRLQSKITDENTSPRRYVESVNGKLVIVAFDRSTNHPQ